MAAPVITSITPVTGITTAGGVFNLIGTGFTGATSAALGGVAATNLVVVSDTQMYGLAGAHAAGIVDVSVTNACGCLTSL